MKARRKTGGEGKDRPGGRRVERFAVHNAPRHAIPTAATWHPEFSHPAGVSAFTPCSTSRRPPLSPCSSIIRFSQLLRREENERKEEGHLSSSIFSTDLIVSNQRCRSTVNSRTIALARFPIDTSDSNGARCINRSCRTASAQDGPGSSYCIMHMWVT